MIRFLADADLNEAIVAGCLRREAEMDFVSANDAHLKGLTDTEVLEIAANHGRILVSHDFQTMPRHFGEFLQHGGCSPGVLFVPQCLPVREAIDELVLIWGCFKCRRVAESSLENSTLLRGSARTGSARKAAAAIRTLS